MFGTAAAFAEEPAFMKSDMVLLLELLPSPPGPDSDITEAEIVDPAKTVWAKPRPPVVDATMPFIRLSKSGSYPSGHATHGMMFGITLAKMMREKRDAFLARRLDFGRSRYVVSVHYLSDIEASKMAGTAIGIALLHDAAFLKVMKPVKAELRAAMGMM